MFTIVYMKSVYSFRFSDEVLKVLQTKDNPRKFVEDLILGKTPQESQQKIPWLDLERRIDELKELLVNGVPEKNNSSPAGKMDIDTLKEKINAVTYEEFE